MSFFPWRRVVVTFSLLWLAAAVGVAQVVEPAEPATDVGAPSASAAQPGPSLALDRESLELPVTIWPSWLPWASEQQASFTVYLRETSGLAAATDVFVTVEPAADTSAKPLLVSENVRLSTVSPRGPTAVVEQLGAGQQVGVRFDLDQLRSGKYGAVLRFRCKNLSSEEHGAVALDLKVPVRYHWVLALAVLLAAIFLSVFANVVLAGLRQRHELLNRICDLKQPWLRDEPPLLPIVWLRALIKQLGDRNRFTVLWGLESLRVSVDEAEHLLGILQRLRNLRNELQLGSRHSMSRYRALEDIDRLVKEIGTGPFGDEKLMVIEKRLAKVEEWLEPQRFLDLYRNRVDKAIQRLLAAVDPSEEYPDIKGAKRQLELLAKKLEVSPQKMDLPQLVALDHDYAKLELLWRYLNARSPLADKLIDKLEKHQPLSELFDVVDSHFWHRLQHAKGRDQLRLLHPSGSLASENRADDLIVFTLGTGDPEVDNSFLFQHVLQVQWKFKLRQGKRRFDLELVSTGPRVTPFFPWKGTLEVEATLVYRDATIGFHGKRLEIGSSGALSSWLQRQKLEAMALLVTILVAALTGLETFYLDNPTFGSFKDYLTLFTWGFAAERLQSYIQSLGAGSQPAQPQPAPGPVPAAQLTVAA